nr:transposase [Sphingobium xenophagum]
MLQVKDRPTTLAKALSELGRIIKTLHILRYIDDRPFRRRILFQLNRQELRHKLGRRVHHGDRGEIRSPLRQGQEEQLGVLGLALNSIVHWNAVYMQETVRQLSEAGTPPLPAISLGSRRYLGVTSISSAATTSPCLTPSQTAASDRYANLIPNGLLKEIMPLTTLSCSAQPHDPL